MEKSYYVQRLTEQIFVVRELCWLMEQRKMMMDCRSFHILYDAQHYATSLNEAKARSTAAPPEAANTLRSISECSASQIVKKRIGSSFVCQRILSLNDCSVNGLRGRNSLGLKR